VTVRALVIDDSRALRMIVRRTLVAAGWEVLEAADGREALDLVAAGPVPHLACVDWNMPVMDGLEFVSAVRAVKAYRDMTLMMVTTESEHAQIVRALAAGAHEYLLKPFTPQDLLDKLDLLGLSPVAV
jgi:two-component system, chemotaxis family, chemotaxis protein CheY